MSLKKEKPIPVKIKWTYSYDKFKLVGINRRVDKKHAVSIAEAIEYRNLLHLFPVIVNDAWEVMDSQHRLSAVKHIEIARMLQLPIYYIMDKNVTMDDISLLNSNKINWKNINYVNFFAGKKVQAFVDLVDFMNEHKALPLSCAIELISSKKRDLGELKKGILKADKVDKAHLIMGYVYDLRERMNPAIPLWKTGNFLSAMKAVVNTRKYRHQVMMDSVRNAPENWERQHSKRAYIFEITETYNYGLSPNEKVNFMKLTKE